MPYTAYHRRISEQSNGGASAMREGPIKGPTFVSLVSPVRTSQEVESRCFAVEANLHGPVGNEWRGEHVRQTTRALNQRSRPSTYLQGFPIQ